MGRERCPSCNELTLLPVIYGMPLPEDLDNPDAIFAGCLIPAIFLDEPVACERENCTWSGGLLDGIRVGSPLLGVAEVLFMNTVTAEGGPLIPVDHLQRMCIEITLGWAWGNPRSQTPNTSEHHAVWIRLEQQIAHIQERGHIVDIPDEWPDLDDYEPGTV